MDLRWMLRLYPRAWRDRYQDEVRAHLEQRGATVATAVDLVIGALDAHLDPAHHVAQVGSAVAASLRIRSSARIVFWAFPLFIFLWAVFILDNVDLAWDTLRDSDPVVWIASAATVIGTLAACGTTVVTALLLDLSGLRTPGASGRRLGLTLLQALVSVVTGLVLAAQTLWLAGPLMGGIQPFAVFWLGLLGLPVVVGWRVVRDELSETQIRLTLLAATVIAACMMAMLAGMLVSQLVASRVWPGGNWSMRLVFGLALLVPPTLLATYAVRRGLHALWTPDLA